MTAVNRPAIALRLAFAGKRTLPPGADLAGRLAPLFATIEAAVAGVVARDRGWYSEARPRLTLISGLADGADQIAATAFLDGATTVADRAIAAILPFDPDAYCFASPMADAERFRALLARAAYVMELDGDARRDLPSEAEEGKRVRAAAFRAQAEVMLRHADVLIAVDDGDGGEAGGTLETTRRALAIGMPVIRLVVPNGDVTVIRTLDEFEDCDGAPAGPAIAGFVADLLAAPASARAAGRHAGLHDGQQALVTEFFGGEERRRLPREHIWRWFERRFRSRGTVEDDTAPEPIEAYRRRANALNERYAGLYRGTFILGYALAVAAVCLAVLSIIVLLRNSSAHSPDYQAWWVLLGLGLAKLAAVIWIQRAARTANRERWAEKAVDYRYLAEGLRTMAYLPAAASFRPPPPLSAPFATRVVEQSIVDRLFHALVRQVNPAEATPPAPGQPIRPRAAEAVAAIRSGWIGRQLAYHRRTATAMAAMGGWLERLGNVLSVAVIAVVCLDLLILVLGGLHVLPDAIAEPSYKVAPWLLFVAAILPAAVASLNGVRFQSECSRLADRSERMISILEGLDRRAAALSARVAAAGARPPPPRLHIIDALRLGEDIARVALDEVAEWSALYAKELVEP
ncbi:MAG: hypothetical protein KIS68_16405 [Bauldia sp.]|nr:hypothetical protein [Bauldia sp.]